MCFGEAVAPFHRYREHDAGPRLLEPAGDLVEYRRDRITSYNVCYTKLLRTAALGRDVRYAGASAAPGRYGVVLFLLSAPIAAPLGEASMVARGPDGEAVAGARFYIGDREFGRQDLRLDQALTSIRVDPDPAKTEQAIRYQALLASVDPSAAFLDSGFSMPVATERRTTLFGMRRRYIYADGGVEASTHNGVDYGS